MFMFLCTFGPGALTFLISEKCAGKNKEYSWINVVIELIAYTAMNAAVVISLLKPFKKVEMIIMADGNVTVRYGITAFLCAFIISVISGIVIAGIKKKLEIKMQILPEEGDTNENKKGN